MTPKEKAEQLIEKHLTAYDIEPIALKSAIITIDEILSFIEDERDAFSWKKYYQEVKKEIEKL